MASELSQRRLASYVADQLVREDTDQLALLRQVAAYMVVNGTARNVDQLVAAIEEALCERGVVVVEVTLARPLTDVLRQQITKYVQTLSAKDASVYLRESVDPQVIGGVRIGLPGREYDGTIQHKLIALAGTK